jgi:hypothetical protein
MGLTPLDVAIRLKGKFLRFSNEKSIFLNIFTIFNQLYNFHCLLLPITVSQRVTSFSIPAL